MRPTCVGYLIKLSSYPPLCVIQKNCHQTHRCRVSNKTVIRPNAFYHLEEEKNVIKPTSIRYLTKLSLDQPQSVIQQNCQQTNRCQSFIKNVLRPSAVGYLTSYHQTHICLKKKRKKMSSNLFPSVYLTKLSSAPPLSFIQKNGHQTHRCLSFIKNVIRPTAVSYLTKLSSDPLLYVIQKNGHQTHLC